MKNEGVVQAFELVLEELDGLIAELNETGGKCFSKGDYDTARSILKDVEGLTEFRLKVKDLENELSKFKLSTSEDGQKVSKSKTTRKSYPSIEQGKKPCGSISISHTQGIIRTWWSRSSVKSY